MMKCRLCGGETKKFLDLGEVPLPEEFRLKSQLKEKINKYDLGLAECKKCGHMQLTELPPIDEIYKKNYFYDFSLTETGRRHWQELAEKLARPGLMVDIGSNTGLLLTMFKERGMEIKGVDPAMKLVRIARKNGVPTICSYFDERTAEKIGRRAKVIVCTNTFDHVRDLDKVMRGVGKLLDKDGVFVVEVPYFERLARDLTHTVYHQQIDYMRMRPLYGFFEKYGLGVVEVQETPLHGGSIRIILKFGKHKKIIKEDEIDVRKTAKKILRQRDELANWVKKIKKSGKTIAGVGASAKGINLLNYAGLGKTDIEFITEKSGLKIGRYTPSGIPIVKDAEVIKRQPDYALLLAWNFEAEIRANLSGFNGKWVIPVPRLKIV
jgi:2-polyprenyl-3-methyl-5-hydroxy-6-metoxy-1,4-benzoquinol methylase